MQGGVLPAQPHPILRKRRSREGVRTTGLWGTGGGGCYLIMCCCCCCWATSGMQMWIDLVDRCRFEISGVQLRLEVMGRM